jgi:hypothetical protein
MLFRNSILHTGQGWTTFPFQLMTRIKLADIDGGQSVERQLPQKIKQHKHFLMWYALATKIALPGKCRRFILSNWTLQLKSHATSLIKTPKKAKGVILLLVTSIILTNNKTSQTSF